MIQVVQIVGAILILVAFAANQRGTMSPRSRTYLWLNFAGSVILAAVALETSNWGFLLLEGVWAAVSLRGLLSLRRERPSRLG
jgi:hypothetical protein